MRDGERPLRVLQVSPPWFAVPPRSYGGTESVVGALARGLTTAGHDVTVLTTGDATTPGEVWHRFDEPPSPQLGDWRVELQHLLNAYRRDLSDLDVIHDHTLLGTAVAAVAVPDVPIVHTLHGPWDDPTTGLLGDVADRVSLVAISHDQAGRAPAGTGVADVVHNGIDLSRFPVGGKGGDYLAFVGRSSPEKAPHLAIDVARMLDRRLVMAVKINEPPEREFWQEWVQPRLEGRDDVEVVEGADHDRKCRVLGGAAATLFPIQWDEPFGIVPVESNACGTPVVTFARGAMPEVVADGTSGRIVAPDADLGAFAAAVDEATGLDPRACREHVEANFSIARVTAGYEAVYRRVLGGGANAEAT